MEKFLRNFGIEADASKESAKELRAKIDAMDKRKVNKLAAEKIASKFDVQVRHKYLQTHTWLVFLQIVRLPPYCCEFNPIELFWAWVKHHLCDLIGADDKIVQIRDIVLQLFKDVPDGICEAHFAHCARLEQVRGRTKENQKY